MMKKFAFLPIAALVSACASHTAADEPSRGLAAVNAPVVTQTAYAFDVTSYGGDIPASEEVRLDAWFNSLGLGYGDAIYVDGGPAASASRNDVARVASRYGLLLSNGAPVTQGSIEAGKIRVVVTRTRADVPDCPNWSEWHKPNWNNRTISNFGCSVNSALADMVANPEDLIHGREGSGVADTRTSARAVSSYRDAKPSGEGGLVDPVNTTDKGGQ